jgi:hypothetical protein
MLNISSQINLEEAAMKRHETVSNTIKQDLEYLCEQARQLGVLIELIDSLVIDASSREFELSRSNKLENEEFNIWYWVGEQHGMQIATGSFTKKQITFQDRSREFKKIPVILEEFQECIEKIKELFRKMGFNIF